MSSQMVVFCNHSQYHEKINILLTCREYCNPIRWSFWRNIGYTWEY